jgi:hypothetical protein
MNSRLKQMNERTVLVRQLLYALTLVNVLKDASSAVALVPLVAALVVWERQQSK